MVVLTRRIQADFTRALRPPASAAKSRPAKELGANIAAWVKLSVGPGAGLELISREAQIWVRHNWFGGSGIGYFRYHGARTNLILHILAVPVFLAGNFTVLMALLRTSIYWITINIGSVSAAIAASAQMKRLSPEVGGRRTELGKVGASMYGRSRQSGSGRGTHSLRCRRRPTCEHDVHCG